MFNKQTYAINRELPGAMASGDYSGLGDDECDELETFQEDVSARFGVDGHWQFAEDERDNWTACAITGAFAECVMASYVYPAAEDQS